MKSVCLHPEIEDSITKWIKKRDYSAVLLLGNPGVGKTTIAHRIFKESGLKTIEFNASHTRSGASFRKIILPLLKEGGILQMMENCCLRMALFWVVVGLLLQGQIPTIL